MFLTYDFFLKDYHFFFLPLSLWISFVYFELPINKFLSMYSFIPELFTHHYV